MREGINSALEDVRFLMQASLAHIYVSIYLYLSLYIYYNQARAYTHTQTHRHTHTHTHTHTCVCVCVCVSVRELCELCVIDSALENDYVPLHASINIIIVFSYL